MNFENDKFNEASWNLQEDLKTMIRVTNLIEDLKDFLGGMTYTVQVILESGENFYLQMNDRRMAGDLGRTASPTIISEPLSTYRAFHLLNGNPEFDIELFHGDTETILHFMDYLEMFDSVVHA